VENLLADYNYLFHRFIHTLWKTLSTPLSTPPVDNLLAQYNYFIHNPVDILWITLSPTLYTPLWITTGEIWW
jgi:hypothetical protein